MIWKNIFWRRSVLGRASVLALFGWMLLSNGFNAMRMSWTYDEYQHLTYGMRFLSGKPQQGQASNVPFSALNALTVRAGRDLGNRMPFLPLWLQDDRVGRFATIFFSLITAFYLMRWARQLYGYGAGVFCLFLYALEPNIQAHSQLITTDIFAMGMGLICVYYLWRYFNSGGERNFFKCCLSVGLSQLAKYTCLLIYPVFLAITAARRICLPQSIRTRRAGAGWITALARVFLLIAISAAIINMAYVFDRDRSAPGAPQAGRSGLFQRLSQNPVLSVPLRAVLPSAYLEGLDIIQSFGENPLMTSNHYLLGHLQTKPPYEGFKGYFFIASIFKVPLPIQILVLLAFVFYGLKRSQMVFYRNEVFLFVPAAFYFVFFNFFTKADIGIRYYLVIFPFYIIFCGLLIRQWPTLAPAVRGFIIGLCAWLILSVLSYFPEYLPYMNEWVPDRKMAYKILADSNIDWGQGTEPYLQEYLADHPRAIVMPAAPVVGDILVPVNYLVGVWEADRYRWLRDNFTPVRHIGYAWLLFRVSQRDLDRLKSQGRL